MIVIKIKGGLGNQMFQYAIARTLSLKYKKKIFLDLSSYKNDCKRSFVLKKFNISYSELKKKSIFQKIQFLFSKNLVYVEDKFTYNESLTNLKFDNILLNGYFQSELYFKEFRKIILNDFKMVDNLNDESLKLLPIINSNESVSIHFRRGDYLNIKLHNILDKGYYKKALDYIESKIKNPCYFIFSDDIKWVKDNFRTSHQTVFVDFNDSNFHYFDMVLMSKCKHNIIANSSFSWWAAWLNINTNKIVVAPNKWFNSSKINTRDLIPNSWIKI